MNASTVELAIEVVPLVLLGTALYRMLLSAGFHNTKYISEDVGLARLNCNEPRSLVTATLKSVAAAKLVRYCTDCPHQHRSGQALGEDDCDARQVAIGLGKGKMSIFRPGEGADKLVTRVAPHRRESLDRSWSLVRCW